MFINTHIHLEDRLKLLRENLYQGPEYYNTKEGLRIYYEGILVEMTQINDAVRESISTIGQNENLFPDDPLFKTNFSGLRKELAILYDLIKNNAMVSPDLKKVFKELLLLLQEAHASLNNPDESKKRQFYDMLLNEFETEHWLSMKQQFHTDYLADLPWRTASRRKQLECCRDDIRKKLDNHPIIGFKKRNLVGDIMDEISKDGELIPESIAPTLFKYRKSIKGKEVVFEFFRLFYVYQIVCAELDKISAKQASTEANGLESWFLGMGNKLLPIVKDDHKARFPQLLQSLCRQPDLKAALMKGTLKSTYNLKLACNLIGLMKYKKLFDDTAFSAIDKMLSGHRQDQYIKAGFYDSDFKNNNVLDKKLRDEACAIIDTYMKKH